MADPTDPTRTDPKVRAVRSAASTRADETVPATTRPDAPGPNFGPPAAPGEVGTLGPYRVVKQLGKGGMGIVYLALDTRLNRKVALKVMLPEFAADTPSRDRFLREAQAAAQVSHDNVVTVYEAAIAGVPYIAMQFLRGYPLDEYLKKKGNPTLAQTLDLAREAALGLAAAHEIGLVHRDIKPANLWLEAPSGRVKVLDFGLARPIEPKGDADLTKTGAIVGTPAYMSPEQARGEKVDHRTDLFSLGAVLYRLCTGRTPFERPTTMAVLMALGTEEPEPVLKLNPAVSPVLARLIHQLLAKDPAQRPQTAVEVADRLKAIADPPWLDPDADPRAASPQPLPQVVNAPLQVTLGPEISAFDDLDAGEPEPAEPQPARPTGRKGLWLGVAGAVIGAVLVVLVVLVVVLSPGKKDGAKTDPPPPDARKDVRPTPVVPKKETPADPDRRAAEYVLSIGGTVQVNNSNVDIVRPVDLPTQSFTLTKIWLRDNRQVTAAGLAACAGCTWLRHLDLVNTAVTDAGLAHFKESKNLFVLDLDRAPQIGDEGLASFAGSTAIGHLWLGGTAVTDRGLAHFRACKSLLSLDVKGTQVTNEGLMNFRGCVTVTRLYISDTAVGDAGLDVFRGCKGLTLFEAERSQVSDAGLAQLRHHTALRDVYLTGSGITARGVADLREALPGCNVSWTGPK